MLEKIIVDPLTDSNCYLLVSGDRVLIVAPNNFQKIHSYLTEKNLTPELVILTHEHCDHIAALNDLRKQYPVKVLCSDACSRGIQSTTLNMTRIMETYLYFKSNGKMRVSYPPFTCQPADITFEKVYTTTWRRHTILCQSAPGHTPGSSCIIVDEALLFSGDYFIPNENVITRLPGGDEQAYEKWGKPVLRSLPTPIKTYPGHRAPFILTKEVKDTYGL